MKVCRQITVSVNADLSAIPEDERDATVEQLDSNLKASVADLIGDCLMDDLNDEVELLSVDYTKVSGGFAGPPGGFVPLYVRTDNDMFDFMVFGDDWLKTLSEDDLAYLCQDTGCNDIWDRFWYDNPPLHEKWEAMAEMLGSQDPHGHGGREMVGFSVGAVDEVKLQAWVRSTCPDAWEIYKDEFGGDDADEVLDADLLKRNLTDWLP